MNHEFSLTIDPTGILASAGPLILVALGGLVSEYAGLLNIGLEGFMLMGAFLAMVGAHFAASWGAGIFWGLSLTILGALLMGGLLAYVVTRRSANIFIAGLAINLLATSLVSLGGSVIFHTRSVFTLPTPVLVPATISTGLAGVSGLGLVLFFWWFRGATIQGLRFRILGSDTAMLKARGVDTDQLKFIALLVSALLASLSGALLSINLGAFVPNQSAGKGWIALVLVFVGGRHPAGVGIACLGFVVLEQLSLAAQAGQAHPALLVGLPYLLVLGVFLFVQIVRRFRRSVQR